MSWLLGFKFGWLNRTGYRKACARGVCRCAVPSKSIPQSSRRQPPACPRVPLSTHTHTVTLTHAHTHNCFFSQIQQLLCIKNSAQHLFNSIHKQLPFKNILLIQQIYVLPNIGYISHDIKFFYTINQQIFLI